MKQGFKLSQQFLENYRSLKPNFGFNGLGELVYQRSYSRLKDNGDYENWADTVERVVNGVFSLRQREAGLNPEQAAIDACKMYDKIYRFKFLPPGRGLWAMGSKITDEKHIYAALNNCAFVSTKDLHLEDPTKPFTFLMDASMLGVGVGFDTKGAGKIRFFKPTGKITFKIPDTREGWVESLRLHLRAFLVEGSPLPQFDYSAIRPAGRILRTFGGISSGPRCLQELHEILQQILINKPGQIISSRDIVDIMNLIGKCVVSGNVRRTAEIAFGDSKDEDFLSLKDYNMYPERMAYGWTSNNSILAELGMDYSKVAECIAKNGEPGLAWLENMQSYSRMMDPPDYKDYRALGGNPCLEQTLESYELCCLAEVFINNHDSFEEFADTLKYAFMYAKCVTLGLTHWKETNEVMSRNRRIGCSLTGISQFTARKGMHSLRDWCVKGYEHLRNYDAVLSKELNIPQSIKITSIKPSGTVSLLAGSTPGMHFPLSRHYIRRIRVPNSETRLLSRLKECGYDIEPDVTSPTVSVVSFPVALDKNIKTISEISMWEQLSLASFLQKYWADNQVSCTVTFKPETETADLSRALDYFQYSLKGISFLPSTPSIPYPQMPYEEITESQYHSMIGRINTSLSLQRDHASPSFPDVFCDNCESPQ